MVYLLALLQYANFTMKLTINGQDHVLDLANYTIASVLTFFKLQPQHVAVELNGTWYSSKSALDQVLKANDRLEIVHFVGGG